MAFTRNWDESQPTDTTQAVDIDDYNRYLRVDCSDRLKNMIYGFIAGENTLAQHFQYIQFYEQSSAPSTPAAGFGRVYCKAVSGKCELFWKDEDGDEIQLTTGGKWNGAVLLAESIPAGSYAADAIDEDDIQLANNAALTAKNQAGDGTVNLILAGTNDLPTLPDSSEMASNAAPVEDEAVANKKYVDDGGMRSVGGTPTVVHTKYLTGTLDSDSSTDVAHGITGVTNILHVSAAVDDGADRYFLWDCRTAESADDAYILSYDGTNIKFTSVGADMQGNTYVIRIDYK